MYIYIYINKSSNMNSEFRLFIKKILVARCRISTSLYNKYFATEDAEKLFIQAFTHKSLKNEPNYELLELEGDVAINASVVKYIRKKFPNITNVGYVTRIKHNLISKGTFSSIAIKNEFFKHVRMSDEFRNENFHEGSKDFININEDVIESICGAITTILDNKSSVGIGFMACYNFITSYLDEMVVDTDYEKVFDAKSRLKLLIDSNKFNFGKTLTMLELEKVSNETKQFYIKLINKSRLITKSQKTQFINILNDPNSKYISIGSVYDNNEYNIVIVLSNNNKSVEQTVSEKLLNIYQTNYNKKVIPMRKY